MEVTEDLQQYVFYKDSLLLKKTNKTHQRIPLGKELPGDMIAGIRPQDVFFADGRRVQAIDLPEPLEEDAHWHMVGLRASYDELELVDYQTAGKAFQILYWDRHSHFCPVCGTATEQHTPIMKKCPSCGYELYPPISTAIIVLIRRGKEILLVHARNFRGTFHGLVAGFLEAGETLEQCVVREVMEETGLQVKNIHYFGSQSWPYPSGLMVGFIADYAGGQVKLQSEELCSGAFFSRDNLPEIPRKLSIARKLIDWWLEHGEEDFSQPTNGKYI